MFAFGVAVLVAGIVACFYAFTGRGSNLLTPEIFLAGVATIVGAILCVVGELVNLRTMIAQRIVEQRVEQQAEEIRQGTDARTED